MKLLKLKIILALTLISLNCFADPQNPISIHGYVYCQYLVDYNNDAWATRNVTGVVTLNTAGEYDFTLSGDFIFVNCSPQKVWIHTYFQKAPGEYNFDYKKNRVLMFTEHREKNDKDHEPRLIYIPINTITTTQGQKHSFTGFAPLRTILGDRYNDFANGNVVKVALNIRVGHPEVKSPTSKFTPKINKYGLSIGIQRAIFKFENRQFISVTLE
ncbi:MAG: hypothetical protein SGI74_10960 [Oligoflexia bacterium]|nr:hypothetical protein [Oligoflexia bacterium]